MKRKDLTRVKGRFFEARSQDLELRALADVLGLVGEMEMQIFGLDENDKKLVFNQELVRGLIVKIEVSRIKNYRRSVQQCDARRAGRMYLVRVRQ